MKTILITIFTFFIYSQSQAQKYAFQDGLIVTQSDDTIYCQVPVTTYFGNKVPIKREKNGQEEVMPLEQIKYLANSSSVYENISYKKRKKEIQKLMWLMIEGNINLYLETSFHIKIPFQNEHMKGYRSPGIKTYVIKKDNTTYLVDKDQFSDIIIPLVSDVPELADKVRSTQYNYEKIIELVKEYNLLTIQK